MNHDSCWLIIRGKTYYIKHKTVDKILWGFLLSFGILIFFLKVIVSW